MSDGDTEKEAFERAKLVLQLMKNIVLNKDLLNIKNRLMETHREYNELMEKMKWELRKTLYKKKLKGSCDCIK